MWILQIIVGLFLLLFNTGTEEEKSNEQTNEEIREEIAEQQDIVYATIADVEVTLTSRIAELREYIDGRFAEYATRIEGPSTESTGTETEEDIQEEVKPTDRHLWFRRVFGD